MKVTDLMIGDWCAYGVNCKGRVTALTDNLITLSVDGDEINGLYILMPDMVNPIPFIEDILVKNGFEKRIYNPSSKSYHLPNFPLNWNDDDGFWFCDGIYTDYVHQLQHLLRLCGIEKEIKL